MARQISFQKLSKKDSPNAYGGDLLKTRKGRSTARPLNTKTTMHMVLRSTKAKGTWSFKTHKNEVKIQNIVNRFAQKYGVKVISLANVGNHLHFHIRLSHRKAYVPFICAITSAIAMAVTGVNRWRPSAEGRLKFWDRRPFTRILESFKEYLNLKDYIMINKIEGHGVSRAMARRLVSKSNKKLGWRYNYSHGFS